MRVSGAAVAPRHGAVAEDISQHAPKAAPQMKRHGALAGAEILNEMAHEADQKERDGAPRHDIKKRIAERPDIPEKLACLH